jgi:hypothetical protein
MLQTRQPGPAGVQGAGHQRGGRRAVCRPGLVQECWADRQLQCVSYTLHQAGLLDGVFMAPARTM